MVIHCDDVDDSTENYVTEFYEIGSTKIEIHMCLECSEFSIEEKTELVKMIVNEFYGDHMYVFNNKKKSESSPLEKNN